MNAREQENQPKRRWVGKACRCVLCGVTTKKKGVCVVEGKGQTKMLYKAQGLNWGIR